QAQDTVNCARQELELSSGFDIAMQVKSELTDDAPCVLLFDGSLIFWHLEAKDTMLRELFLHKYLATLYQLYEARILNAGYISLPKSRELVNLVRIALCNFDGAQQDVCKVVDKVVDANIGSFYLSAHTRSIVFQNNSDISSYYPRPLRPHFFYLHVGTEIGRVEIPGWIAQDEKLVDQVAQIILDQSIKGHGYPVVLAEAHEQAVVKGPDRDFFYQMLHKIGMTQQRSFSLSQKVVKKRRIGI
ncbi:MAG TPA: DNA double-strand break repair nuclease NurA, partial [Candidatus Babeliales bacterium]|nr:DNA double-strand break repair nuclease NurA [Candidatus Babeliales bacterium]